MGLSKKIAYRLQTVRASSGLSQQEVAAKADLSLSLVAKMEQGRKADPRASTLLALAGALGVRPGELIEDLTPPPEGTFPAKGKKGKKGKKQREKVLAAPAGAAPAAAPQKARLSVVADAQGLVPGASDKPERKKTRKKVQ